MACMVRMFSSAALTPASTGVGIGFGGVQRGFLRLHIGFRLHVFDARQQLAFSDPVAFLDQEFADLALRVGADVDVILGLNFAGCSDEAGQILAHARSGLHRDQALFAINRAGIDPDSENRDQPTRQ